jgi:hypothetical protein
LQSLAIQKRKKELNERMNERKNIIGRQGGRATHLSQHVPEKNTVEWYAFSDNVGNSRPWNVGDESFVNVRLERDIVRPDAIFVPAVIGAVPPEHVIHAD